MTKHTDYNDDEQLRRLVQRSEEEDGDYNDDEVLDEEYEDNTLDEAPDDEEDYEDEEEEYEDDDNESNDEDDSLDDEEDEDCDENEDKAQPSRLVEDSREDWKRFRAMFSRDLRFFLLFCFVLLLSAAYWTTHFNQSIRKLTERERILKDLRYLRLYTTADLVRLERINNIEASIKKMQLDLEFPSQPPYEVIDTLSEAKSE